MYEFPVDRPLSVDLRIAAGRCTLTADETDTATVEVEPMKDQENARRAAADTIVQLSGDELVIKTPDTSGVSWLFGRRSAAVKITVRVPADSALDAKTASADITCAGRLRALSVNDASGSVTVEHVTGDASINTASGDVRLGRVEGSIRCNSASGDLHADYVGQDVTNNSASGSTTLGTTMGTVKTHSASGDLRVGSAAAGTVKASTASGDVTIGVPAGTGVWLDLNTASGTTTSDLAIGAETPLSGHDLELRVSTASGDIAVHRVA